MNINELIYTISYDINNGVYNNFTTLRIKLENIIKSLVRYKNIDHAYITQRELKLLIENEYLKEGETIIK